MSREQSERVQLLVQQNEEKEKTLRKENLRKLEEMKLENEDKEKKLKEKNQRKLSLLMVFLSSRRPWLEKCLSGSSWRRPAFESTDPGQLYLRFRIGSFSTDFLKKSNDSGQSYARLRNYLFSIEILKKSIDSGKSYL